jgi:hypothetical protein
MDWIKKNLVFVVGLAVSLALLAGAVIYLLGSKEAAEAADAELVAKNQQLDDLVKLDPYPNQDNVERTKAEQKRVAAFIADARKRFGISEKVPDLDNASFKSLLEGTIAALEREAERAGVKLPAGADAGSKYSFTFAQQRQQLQLPANSLEPFARQLSDIQNICEVLFDSKIHTLVHVKRSAVGTNDPMGSAETISKKVATNSVVGATSYPYEVAFQSFSAELGSVLEGFANAPQSYVLKTVNVERGVAADAPVATPVFGSPFGGGGPGGMDPVLARRYGLGRPAAPVAPVVQAAPTRPNEPVLDEKPLRVTIGLEVVRLNPPPPAPAAPVRRPAPPVE